ncbi:uncharacterized protein LOC131299665 [Rhododendron vialii]|uniref:uncharacterized protein LOC131299665 n=1 Tax=Rhododendron vialii TaxID=182163 RepID=UPI00265DAA51|nr:uncharacterized protein LOC131299665 [Rhododendron vialii]
MFLFQMSSSFNPLSVILSQNKLVGPNYVDWKWNLNIVLTAEGYTYVLTENCPPLPTDESTDEERKKFKDWKKADEMAKCYILASMSNVLQHQHQSFGSASDIMLNLKEMFGEQGRAARQHAMRQLMNTKMGEGTPVGDHVLKMIDFLNVLEVLGAEIDGQSQVDIILESLHGSFKEFKLNYNMNKMDLSLSELMNSLQAAEGIIKPNHSVLSPGSPGS